MQYSKLLILLLILIYPAFVFAQERTDTLDAVRVAALMRKGLISSPQLTVDSANLKERGLSEIKDVLNSMAGVSVRDFGGLGGLKTVSVRNMGAHHTSVSYDGISLSDTQSGMVDLNMLPMDNVQSISVGMGSGSLRSSARELLSASSLVLKREKPVFSEGRKTRAEAAVKAGSFGFWGLSAAVQQKVGKRDALEADASWASSQGRYPYTYSNGSSTVSEKRLGADAMQGSAELNYHHSDIVSAKARFFASERGLPGPVIFYTQHPTERLLTHNSSVSITYNPLHHLKNKAGKLPADLRLNAAWVRQFDRHTDTSALYSEKQRNVYLQNEYALGALVHSDAIRNLELAFATDFFCNTLYSNIPECRFPLRLNSVSALSAQYSPDFAKGLVFTGHFTFTRVKESFHKAGDKEGLDVKRPGGYAGVIWKKESGKHSYMLRASWKNTFRLPTFNDLYYARVGNSSLRPEKMNQLNIGAGYSIGGPVFRFELTADAYHYNVKDKIVAVPTLFIWKMQNVGKVRMNGVDIAAHGNLQIADWLRLALDANFSWQKAIDLSDAESKSYGHQTAYTPEFTGYYRFGFISKWFTLNYTALFIGERYVLGQNIAANRMPPYADHGLSLNREFSLKKLRLYASLDALNLGGKNYQIIRHYPMPGRTFRLSLRLKF